MLQTRELLFLKNMKIQKEKIIIILTVFLNVLGIGIVIPILPFYVQSFGISAFGVSILFAIFSFFSFVSSPYLGALSDKIGRRPVLIISIISTAIGWIVFASAKGVFLLFLGRIIDGMAAGNIPIAQSYLSDISKNNKERTANLGLISATFGVGLIIGPALGATLSVVSPVFPFWVVAFLSIINVVAAIIYLPETNKNINKEKKIKINPFLPLMGAIKNPLFKARYFSWFLFGIAVSGMQALFALYLSEQFGFNSVAVGYVFTIMGIATIINQAYALKKFWLKFFSESVLEVWLFLFFAIGFLLMSISHIAIFFMGISIVAITQSVLRVVVTSRVAELAGDKNRGEALGTLSSVMSASTMLGPILLGAIFEFDNKIPFVFSACLLFGAFYIMKKFRKLNIEERVVVTENSQTQTA